MMNLTEKFVNPRTALSVKRALPVAALLLAASLPAFAASKLDRIEFKPSGAVTEIQLHSESILPYHVAYISDNKMMIDFENVESEGTIDTRFLGTSENNTISNIVLQPLNEHSLRLIIRGEHLAPPQVGFTPIHTDAPKTIAGTTPAKGDNATAPLIPESFADAPAPIVHQAPQKAKIQGAGIAQDLTPMAQADVKRPKAEALQDPMAMFTQWSENSSLISAALTYIPYGIIAVLLIGLGLFLKNKIGNMSKKRNGNQFEELLDQQARGKSIGFHQLANSYRQNETEINELPRHSEKSDAVRGEELIGLGRLRHSDEQALPAAKTPDRSNRDEQAKRLQEQLLQQASAAAPKTAPRQAANQYAQNQRPAANPKAKQPAAAEAPARKRQLSDDQLRHELKRANEARQETRQQLRQEALKQQASTAGTLKAGSNMTQSPLHKQALQQRQGTANRQASAKAPLSGNPEVLNFLRDVADLMDKDGRGNMAQSFRKGINNPQ